MGVALQVQNDLSTTPQAITDGNNSTSVYLTSSPSGKLVFGAPGEWIQNTSEGTGPWGLAFYGNSAERMRLTNGGQLGINTDSPTATLHVNGTVRLQGLSGSGDLIVDSSGNVSIQVSSARFKKNIRDLEDDFRKLLSLRPVAFQYKDSGVPSVGYLAEEVAEQGLENLVENDSEGKPVSVRYKMISVYLVELVKQQHALIEQLQEQIAEVRERFNRMETLPASD